MSSRVIYHRDKAVEVEDGIGTEAARRIVDTLLDDGVSFSVIMLREDEDGYLVAFVRHDIGYRFERGGRRA